MPHLSLTPATEPDAPDGGGRCQRTIKRERLGHMAIAHYSHRTLLAFSSLYSDV